MPCATSSPCPDVDSRDTRWAGFGDSHDNCAQMGQSLAPLLLPQGKRCKDFRLDRRGAAAVEFGLVILPVPLLILGIIEGGRMLWTQNALQYAVEQAARCAVINSTICDSTAQIQNYAASMASGLNLNASVF
jgi:Flp pilus assembly pilin Flp